MKILFILGGLTHYYKLVLNRLNEMQNVSISLIVPKDKDGVEKEAVHLDNKGVNFKYIELNSKNFHFFYSFEGLLNYLSSEKPDIIITIPQYAISFCLNPFFRIQRYLLKYRVILKSIPFRVPTWKEGFANLRNIKSISYFKWLTIHILNRYMYKNVNGHVCYIDDAFSIYGSYGVPKEKIFITYNSPDTDHFFKVREKLENESNQNPPFKPHRIIHVGRLVAWKRVDLLIEAVSLLKQKFTDIELSIAGFGPEENYLKSLVREKDISDKVNFLGGVYETEELGRHLRSSGLYVLAGMGGLSINDAMCFGLPVICSICDGTEKMLVKEGKNGFFFKDGDLIDLSEKIGLVLGDDKLRISMGHESTRIIKEEINIHTVLKGYMNVFQNFK